MSRLAVLGLAGFLLAACGIHPGSAAMVDGTRISMDEVDSATNTFCVVSSANSDGSGGQPDLITVRRQALGNLVVGAVADEIADDRGYKIAETPLSAADKAQIDKLFGDQADNATDLIMRNQRTSAIALEMAKDAGVTGGQEAETQAGQQLLAAEAQKMDIAIDPRFGLSDDLQELAATGSLSVAAIALDDTASEDRPAALKCATT